MIHALGVDRERAAACLARPVDRRPVGRGVRAAGASAPAAGEQWAWLIVLVQGVVLLPVAIPIAWGFSGPGTVSATGQAAATRSNCLDRLADAESGMAGPRRR